MSNLSHYIHVKSGGRIPEIPLLGHPDGTLDVLKGIANESLDIFRAPLIAGLDRIEAIEAAALTRGEDAVKNELIALIAAFPGIPAFALSIAQGLVHDYDFRGIEQITSDHVTALLEEVKTAVESAHF